MTRKNKRIRLTPKPISISSCQTKRAYINEAEAIYAADTHMLESMSLDLRVYKCSDCHKWHLTKSAD
jgi:hypothetical protein